MSVKWDNLVYDLRRKVCDKCNDDFNCGRCGKNREISDLLAKHGVRIDE